MNDVRVMRCATSVQRVEANSKKVGCFFMVSSWEIRTTTDNHQSSRFTFSKNKTKRYFSGHAEDNIKRPYSSASLHAYTSTGTPPTNDQLNLLEQWENKRDEKVVKREAIPKATLPQKLQLLRHPQNPLLSTGYVMETSESGTEHSQQHLPRYSRLIIFLDLQ